MNEALPHAPSGVNDVPKTRLRRFRAGDEAALHDVHVSAIHTIASRHYTREQVLAWAPAVHDAAAWAERMRVLQPFVVERDGVIVAYADLQPSGTIDHFFVSGTTPRQGIGRMLMDRIHHEAGRLGLAALTADVSLTAEPFFASFGFEIVARQSPVRHGVSLRNARMRKSL